MNERIMKLAKQATEEVMRNTPSFLVTNEMWQEKFVELIVRECCVVMFADPRLSDVRTATRGCARSIKEYFGVEE